MNISYPIDWNDKYTSYECTCKGWLSNVVVTLENGNAHNLAFYDPVRLSQDLESEIKNGKAGIIEKNLFVIPEVTKANIALAVEQAIKEGYFEKNS